MRSKLELRSSSSIKPRKAQSTDNKEEEASVTSARTSLEKLQCKICGKTFANAATLKRHIRDRVNKCRVKKFKCDECYKSYTRKRKLLDHKFVHQEGFRFSCINCGTKFKDRNKYDYHKKKCNVLPLSAEEETEEISIEIKEEIMDNENCFEFKIPELPEIQSPTNNKNLPKSPKEKNRKRKRKSLKIKARQVINCVMHYHFIEKDSDGCVMERWLPVFDVDDFNDVVEFEKFIAKVEIGSEEDNFNPMTESHFLLDR